MKFVIIFFFIFCLKTTLGQSKKDQIELLTQKCDSLSLLISNERKTNANDVQVLETRILEMTALIEQYREEYEANIKALNNSVFLKQQTIDSLNTSFSEQDIYQERIVFIKNGDLYQQPIGSGETNPSLTVSSGKIISMVSIGNHIYYGELSGFSLTIFRINLSSQTKEKYVTIKGDERDGYFLSEDETGELIRYGENSLIVSANFQCCEGAYFADHFEVDLVSKKSKKIEDYDAYKLMPSLNSFEFESTTQDYSPLKAKKYGNEYELCKPLTDGTLKRITNTQNITPRACWDEIIDYIDFTILNNGKILFYIITSCGDLAHGNLFLINEDGTFQTSITENYSPGMSHDPFRSLKDNSIYYLNEDGILMCYKGQNNIGSSIAEEVSCFMIVNGI